MVISPRRIEKIEIVVKIKTKPITIGLLGALIASGNIFPIPGAAKTVSVIVAPAIVPITADGIPLTNGIAAFLKMCLRLISPALKPFALANFT